MQFDFTWFPDTFFDFFNIFGIFFIIVPIFVVVIFIVVFVNICRASQSAARGFTVQAPSFVIPERYQGRTRTDGTQYKTVRLPEKCPSCGASLSHESIDWVGPLEAQCNYCGGTVRAQFDNI